MHPNPLVIAVKQNIERLIGSGQAASAKDSCAKLCQQHRNDPHTWFLMSAIHAQLGDYAEAESCCRKIIRLAPKVPAVHLNRGIALMMLRRVQEAIESFLLAIRLQPDLVDAHVNLGEALRSLKKYERACNAYRDAIRMRPQDPAIQVRLGATLRESGNLTDAEQHLRQTMEIDPRHIPAMLELGRLKVQLGQYAEASDWYREALSIDPCCRDALEQIGGIEINMGNPEAAVENYAKILDFSPKDTAMRILVARILAPQGALERAENICRQGLEFDPHNVALHCELGKILSEQGKATDAAEVLRSAKALVGSSEEIEYLLSSLDRNDNEFLAKQKYIRKLFNDYADSFDNHLRDRLEYRGPEMISQIAHDAGMQDNGNLTIIDLGCGTGLCGPLFRHAASKLIGVDLSARMLEKARERSIYDELHEADIVEILQRTANAYDVVIAADVFVYVGNIAPVFSGAATSLRPGGLLVFSAETVPNGTYVLRNSGRYGHSQDYVHALARDHGFDTIAVKETMIRKDSQKAIPGHIYGFKKKPD